jgi:trehalose 6-phosphate phosphatase
MTDAPPLPIPSPDWALFLDFDGTLVDIAATPSAIEVPAELPGILQRLRRALNGAVALVSGRALGDLDHFVGALDLPAAGQHGAEMRMADGIVHALFGRNGVAPFLADIEAFAAARPGLLVENKGASVALHYRLAPRYRDEVPRFLGALASRTEGRLETMTGHGVVEIKPRGANKGAAVSRFLEDPPFRGRVPVFIGDDVTDEDGFRAALDRGGAAIKVGLTGESLATSRIADPAAARRWLAEIGERLAAAQALVGTP